MRGDYLMKKYLKPSFKEVKFNTQSTTVLGNCTWWKGSGGPIIWW